MARTVPYACLVFPTAQRAEEARHALHMRESKEIPGRLLYLEYGLASAPSFVEEGERDDLGNAITLSLGGDEQEEEKRDEALSDELAGTAHFSNILVRLCDLSRVQRAVLKEQYLRELLRASVGGGRATAAALAAAAAAGAAATSLAKPSRIPGLLVVEDFVTALETQQLSEWMDTSEWEVQRNRHVQHHGFRFDYKINNVHEDKPLAGHG